MIPKNPSFPALLTLFTALGALTTSAYIEDGFVQANIHTQAGSTASANQALSLAQFYVGGVGFGSANATAGGPMSGTLNLTSVASINSAMSQGGSNASSELRITDTLTINVPYLATGTTVYAKLEVTLDGNVGRSSSGDVTTQAQAQVLGPHDEWLQESNNLGDPLRTDSDGTHVFLIPLKVGQPEEDNLDLSVSVASANNLNIGADPMLPYSAGANASLEISLGEIVDVVTLGGKRVYGWTVSAESLLDYGEGEAVPPPPAKPVLEICRSILNHKTLVVAWNADPADALILQGSTNGKSWFKDRDIDSQLGQVVLTQASRPKHKLFRLVSTAATGPLTEPELMISAGSTPGKYRLSWQAHAAEAYHLRSSPRIQPADWAEIYSVSEASGLISVEVDKEAGRQVFQLRSNFN